MRRRDLLAGLLLVPASRAHAALDRVLVETDGGYPLDVVRAIPLYRGVRARITLFGKSLADATRVELGPDVSIPTGDVQRAPGKLTFVALPSPSALLGPRDLKVRFAVELAGPEVFPTRVLRDGEITAVDPRRVPPDKKVIVTFTGRDLGSADILAVSAFREARVLPGGSEGRVQVELTFTREGLIEVPLYDSGGPPRPGLSPRDPGGYRRRPEAFVEVKR